MIRLVISVTTLTFDEAARVVQADLGYLIERGERLADRMDTLVRIARPLATDPIRELEPREVARPRSQAERDLLKALRLAK